MYHFITKCMCVWKEIVNMSIGWVPDMIGWGCSQPFPTLATPLAKYCVHKFVPIFYLRYRI